MDKGRAIKNGIVKVRVLNPPRWSEINTERLLTVPRYRHEREELSPLPPCLSSLGNSLPANILNYLCNMLRGKRESSEEAFTQFKSFNLTACGVMMTCDEGRGEREEARLPTLAAWQAVGFGPRTVCGCQDFLDQMSGSRIDGFRRLMWKSSEHLIVNWQSSISSTGCFFYFGSEGKYLFHQT